MTVENNNFIAKPFLKDLEVVGTSFQTIKFCMQLVSG
jgi:hypothetical protein